MFVNYTHFLKFLYKRRSFFGHTHPYTHLPTHLYFLESKLNKYVKQLKNPLTLVFKNSKAVMSPVGQNQIILKHPFRNFDVNKWF